MTNSNAMTPSWMVWTGRVFTVLACAALGMSASMKLMQGPEVVAAFGDYGFAPSTLVPIGVAELSCVVLYLVPRTSVLGGVLLAAYLGGAVATHVAAEEAFVAPIVVAVLAWGGLWVREPRLRDLLPLRRA